MSKGDITLDGLKKKEYVHLQVLKVQLSEFAQIRLSEKNIEFLIETAENIANKLIKRWEENERT